MNKKVLIPIIITLAIILIAGLILCISMSAPKDTPMQDDPVVTIQQQKADQEHDAMKPTVTEDEEVSSEPANNAIVSFEEKTQESKETNENEPVQSTEQPIETERPTDPKDDGYVLGENELPGF